MTYRNWSFAMLLAFTAMTTSVATANEITADCEENKWTVTSDALNDRCTGTVYVYVKVTICDEDGATVGTSKGCALLENVTDPSQVDLKVCGRLGELDPGTYSLKADVRFYSSDDTDCDDADSEYYARLAADCLLPSEHPTASDCTPGACSKEQLESDPFHCEGRKGGEGCTPGFWKNHKHLWSGYSPDDTFADVFGVEVFGDASLCHVVGLGGGGVKALGRHAVAALLNAASPHVDYGLSEEEIIARVCDAIHSGEGIERLKDMLDHLNNKGCFEKPKDAPKPAHPRHAKHDHDDEDHPRHRRSRRRHRHHDDD